MTRREPEWDQWSRDAAIALEMHEDGLCGSCGLPRSICHDPKNAGRFRAEGPDRCHASTAVMIAQERHGETNQPKALSWQPVLID